MPAKLCQVSLMGSKDSAVFRWLPLSPPIA